MFLILLAAIIVQVAWTSSDIHYIVHTDECKIPYFPDFNEEVNATLVPQEDTSCADSDLLTFTIVKNNTAYLHLKKTKTFDELEEPPSCCYSYVTRNGTEEEPDVGIEISECVPFNNSVQLEADIVKISCEDKDGNLVYENVHNPITISESVQQKLDEHRKEQTQQKRQSKKKRRPISILFIVIDSLSRKNFKRTMPLTRKELLSNDFYEFVGYNKVEDNTYPNFMALLTGMTYREMNSKCNPREVGQLDQCPMIWYDFRDLGYVTAYAEDWAAISTFNYNKKGFIKPPTDYYFKPYIEAAETLNVKMKYNGPYCTGPETEGERILSLAKDFAITFKRTPSFGIFWMNTFSHNDISAPMSMDAKVADFFHNLKVNDILSNSVVFLLSDHGIRFGKFRQSIQGWFEERLPVNFISLPQWFKVDHKEKFKNLLESTSKLTSTYDLYMTLQDLLKLSVPSYNVSSSTACPTCQSFFTNITKNRSCRHAGIPEAWCTCVGEVTTDDARITEETKAKAAKLTLREIKRLERLEPASTFITKIILAAVNRNRTRKSYLWFVVETDAQAIYQVLFRIRGDPVDFVRVVKIFRLY